MSLFSDVAIDIVLYNITLQWSNKFAIRQESQNDACITDKVNVCISKTVIILWMYMKYVELWCNNDNNDNIHAGAKFDAGGGAETSFPLTMALCWNKNGCISELITYISNILEYAGEIVRKAKRVKA